MKPSWSEVAVLGLLLLFAVLMAIGWPSLDWALWWAAIGAVGTWAVGSAAWYIAYTQHKKKEREEERTQWLLVREMRETMPVVFSQLISAIEAIKDWSVNYQHDFSRPPIRVNTDYAQKVLKLIRELSALQKKILRSDGLAIAPDEIYIGIKKFSESLDGIKEGHTLGLAAVISGHSIKVLHLSALMKNLEKMGEVLIGLGIVESQLEKKFKEQSKASWEALDGLYSFLLDK